VFVQTNAGIVKDLITAVAEHAPGVRLNLLGVIVF
jgi:hypothetical protein